MLPREYQNADLNRSHDFAIWAKSFGAEVSENITKRTSHVIASPLRKTAKVRQAAKKPEKIKIVSQDWLFACLSQWRKVDESPYRLHADLEHEPIEPVSKAQGSPFDGPDQNAQLSSSDEEAAITEEEDTAETPTTGYDTDARELRELERYMPSLPREASSALKEDIDDWDAELDDFMNGESLGEESEADMPTPSEDAGSFPSGTKKKRKRDESLLSADNDNDDSDSSLSSSKLQRRKRKALARTTSLVSVAAITDSRKGADGDNQQNPSAKARDEIIDEDEDDLDFEAQLEAEMARQAEEEGDA
jgi:RNA polymerase II subunit A-like phosphatase